MSYLHTPRLVFSGDFLSDVSTVNNDTAHYNNATFEPSFQKQALPGNSSSNGWWNPEGGAVFNFQKCTIKNYTLSSGKQVSHKDGDGLIGELITGADGRATGKMVDLDPQQQGCSELWSVILRILNAKGEVLMEGQLETTAFRDLQMRQHGGAKINGQGLGGTWTTVLTNVIWGDEADNHPFFKELRATTQGGNLSLNLNAFGYYYNHAKNGRFSLGKIIGAIGPWFEGEPLTFAPARRLYGIINQNPNGQPKIYFNNSNFLLNTSANSLVVDFGSSFPIVNAEGEVKTNDTFLIAMSNNTFYSGISGAPIMLNKAGFTKLGELKYQNGPDWLLDTGGIVTISDIPSTTVQKLAGQQLLLLKDNKDGTYTVLARESTSGYLLRADNFVQRLDSGQKNIVKLYAYQWGTPAPNEQVSISMEKPTAPQPLSPSNPISAIPGNNTPQDGLSFASAVTTDSGGCAQLELTGNSIATPRDYLDGQMYTLDYSLSQVPEDPVILGPYTNDYILIHLRSHFDIPENPKWSDIAYTMTQYSNLYPIMSKYLVDLSNPHALKEKTDILTFAFSRDIKDPLYMPATRDLSENKRLTILKWLAKPLIDDTAETIELNEIKASHSPAYIAPPETPVEMTKKQENLKNAMKAKSGEGLDVEDVVLFNF